MQFVLQRVVNFQNTHLHRVHRRVLADHAQLVVSGVLHLVFALFSYRSRQPLSRRAPGQGGHRGPAHGFVLFPMFPLAVGVAVVGLGALGTLWQLVSLLAALKTLEDRDPQGFLMHVFLLFRGVLHDGMLRGAAVKWWLRFGRG